MLHYTKQVAHVLKEEGISLGELSTMVDRAAITSLRGYNRRYNHWLFKMRDGAVEKIALADMLEIGSGQSIAYETHDSCNGRGCRDCGWGGEIIRHI